MVNSTTGSVKTTVPLEPTVNLSAASQSGSTTTYSYTLISGPAIRPGMEMVIAGMSDPGNNGTFTLASTSFGVFTVINNAGVTASGQAATGAVVVEVSTAPPTGCDVSGLGVPGGVVGGARFRSFAAASADSTKVMIAKCDAGSISVIRTLDDLPVVDMAAPLSVNSLPNGGNPLAAKSRICSAGTMKRGPVILSVGRKIRCRVRRHWTWQKHIPLRMILPDGNSRSLEYLSG